MLSHRGYNERAELFVACPITNRGKGYPFEVAIPTGGAVTGVVLADQVRSLSWVERRTELIATASDEVLDEVRAKLTALVQG